MAFGRALRHEWPFALALAVVAVGLLAISFASEHWLRGVVIIASGFGVAAVLRLVLPDERAGLLRIRRRSFDVACFGVVSVLAVIFGVLLPRA
jgi:uncharacterized membrane protein YwaF